MNSATDIARQDKAGTQSSSNALQLQGSRGMSRPAVPVFREAEQPAPEAAAAPVVQRTRIARTALEEGKVYYFTLGDAEMVGKLIHKGTKLTFKKGKEGDGDLLFLPTAGGVSWEDPAAGLPAFDDTQGVYADNMNLKAVAAKLRTSDDWNQDDNYLLEVLRNAFEANWFKAKDCLIMDKWPADITPIPPHARSIQLMKLFTGMRDHVWRTFADATKPKIMGAIDAKSARITDRGEGQPGMADRAHLAKDKEAGVDKNVTIGDADGSDSVSSDVDLPLRGKNTEIAVDMVNTEFRKYFHVPYEPGTMFDINVYASDWIHGDTQTGTTEGIANFTTNPEANTVPASKADKEAREDEQEIWGLVKVRRNIPDDEWTAYANQVKEGLSGSKLSAMEKKLTDANSRFLAFRTKVDDRVRELRGKFSEEEDGLLRWVNRGTSQFAAGGVHAHHKEEALRTRASNAIYQDTLFNVRRLRMQLERYAGSKTAVDPAIVEPLKKQLASLISEGLTYANEVYATEGAVLHTVLVKQGSPKKLKKLKAEAETLRPGSGAEITEVRYTLTPAQNLQSVHENVGDSLHSLEHYKSNPRYAIYRAGKYLDRLCEAADMLLGPAAVRLPHYAALKEIGDESVKAKKGTVGKDPLAVNTHDYFAPKGASWAEVRTQLRAFGATATREGQAIIDTSRTPPSPPTPSSPPTATLAE